MTASLVFLNWMRPENLTKILDKQSKYKCVTEIVILNNNPSVPFVYSNPKVKIINASENFGTHARWSVAALASSDVIIFQDDDIMLPEITVLRMIESIRYDYKGMYGLIGRNFTGKYNAAHVDGQCDILLTRAVAIHRSSLGHIINAKMNYLTSGQEFPHKNGEDIFMSYAMRSYSKKRPVSLCLPWKDLPAPHALSARPEHIPERTRLCKAFAQFFKV